MLEVLEIFDSIDGEGLRAGELTTFVRLSGCNLHCRYCDTAYSIRKDNPDAVKMGEKEILEKVKYHNVTITGGEPLSQVGTWDLAYSLAKAGHSVNIETNGTYPVPPPENRPGIFVTMDYKCRCSGHHQEMKAITFTNLGEGDVIKAVVDSEKDMQDALEFIRGLDTRAWVYISPCWGFETAKIVDFMKQQDLQGKFRVQLQLHKYIWDPKARMV